MASTTEVLNFKTAPSPAFENLGPALPVIPIELGSKEWDSKIGRTLKILRTGAFIGATLGIFAVGLGAGLGYAMHHPIDVVRTATIVVPAAAGLFALFAKPFHSLLKDKVDLSVTEVAPVLPEPRWGLDMVGQMECVALLPPEAPAPAPAYEPEVSQPRKLPAMPGFPQLARLLPLPI